MNGAKTINKFNSALPAVRKWIEELLERYTTDSINVNSLGFSRLRQHFPVDLLERAKVVTVPRVPFPPLSQLGLPELSGMEQMSLAGITYMDTIFVNHLNRTESLHFHELVHVVQWERLGVNNFLFAYGVGLVQFGYDRSPFEQMAYNLQLAFEQNSVPSNLAEFIQKQTDTIWCQVAPLVR